MEALLQELIAEVKDLKAAIVAQHADVCEGLDLLCGVFYEFEEEGCEEGEEESAPAV